MFFVISGFLITRSLLAEARRDHGISLAGFYARRVRRLLPAAAMVLGATAVAVRALLPRTMWQDFGGDIAAAAAYVVNWRLAARSVDYLAEDVSNSPGQHFWSLAVEEQFYFLWPLLVLAGTWLALRRSWRIDRTLVWLLLVVVLLPSLAWSVALTVREPARAFFDTGTRLWELSIGAVAAGIAPWFVHMGRRVRVVGRVVALALLALAAVAMSPSAPWPGALAHGVTAPTAALILLGERHADDMHRDVVDRILGVRPMQRVGAWSYSLYLWHWPPLAILAARWGGLSAAQASAIVVLSAAPAVLSYHYVENPLRHAATLRTSPRFALSVGANLSLVGLLAGILVPLGTRSPAPAATAVTAAAGGRRRRAGRPASRCPRAGTRTRRSCPAQHAVRRHDDDACTDCRHRRPAHRRRRGLPGDRPRQRADRLPRG